MIMQSNRCIAVVLSGGKGLRFGCDEPKQYLKIDGKMVIEYCLETLIEDENISGIWIVAEPSYQKMLGKVTSSDKLLGFSLPGENRQLSIYNALKDIKSIAGEDDIVMIHDAARPFVSHELIARCLDGLTGHDGVMPAIPMTDTIYRVSGDMKIVGLENRSEIVAGQAPEFFNYSKYKAALDGMTYEEILKINGSTEPAIIAGLDMVIVPGDKSNIKITTKEDLKYFDNNR